MGIIFWVMVGLIAGLLSKWIIPGSGPAGFIVTALIGVAGASMGAFIVRLFGSDWATGFSVWTILAATLGAIILLFLYALITRQAT